MSEGYPIYKKIGFLLGPILFLVIYNLPFQIISAEADDVLAVAIWMVSWWITEAVSISVTALIPLAIFPLVGIMDMKTVSANYGSPIVFLFFGGFVMALALEKVNLHRRIALNIIRYTGTTPDKVILGFMLATASLSMWISNTATAVVMLPIALSVIDLLIKDEDGFAQKDKNFALCLMLGIAFSANVGGVATIIGTPPNIVMTGFMEQEYGIQISFLKWMLMGIPFTCLMIALIYILLVKVIYPSGLSELPDSDKIIDAELVKLGKVDKRERRVIYIFVVTILLWIFRSYVNEFLPFINLSNAGISMLAALALFSIPFEFNKGEFSLEWKDTVKLPWGILILFGGGLSLASGLSSTGVIDFIGELVSTSGFTNIFIIASFLILIMLFMTELMSNVALVAIFCPVVAGIAIGLDYEVLHLMIPVTMAASCAFMLPMATPPNAIIFASGYVKVHEMAKAGVVLNLISVIIIIVFSIFVIPFVFGG